MNLHTLKTMNLSEAAECQFKLVDAITRHFKGAKFLETGSVGVEKSPHTASVEECLADFFGVEACALVRGAGTGALRWCLYSLVPPGGRVLVHDAPIYPTTQTSFEIMHIQTLTCNFNSPQAVMGILSAQKPDAALIQLSRQKLDDSYDMSGLISFIKQAAPSLPIICDDNYGVMKVPKISAALGADISGFSMFKLLGPEGIGCVAGKAAAVNKIKAVQYSGGSQVQGHEAMECLRWLVYTPLALALQSSVIDTLVKRLNKGAFPFIKNAFAANAQSKVLLIELSEPIAPALLKEAEKLGALPCPVGAESRYDVPPLFYKVSGTFLKEDPQRINTMIRINPNRSGAETVMRILKEAYQKAKEA